MSISAIMPNRLVYFAAVYRLRDLQAAADSIPMTIQGVRKAVRHLEADLHVPLFTQGNGTLEPTPYADRLYELVRAWNIDASCLERDFRSLGGDNRASVSLGAALGVPGCLGVGFDVDCEADNPNIHLDVAEMPDRAVDNGLIDCEFDLALTTAPFNEAFVTIPLFSTPVTVWVNRSDPLSEKKSLVPTDLAGKRIGIIDAKCKVFGLIMDALAQAGCEPTSVSTTSELFWLLDFARRGSGLGVGVTHVAKLLGCDDEVVSLPFDGIRWEFGISWRKGHRLSESQQAVVDWLADRCQQLGAEE